MVCLLVLSKGRTSFQPLQPLCNKIDAVQLAMGSYLLHALVGSDEDPTDAASRLWAVNPLPCRAIAPGFFWREERVRRDVKQEQVSALRLSPYHLRLGDAMKQLWGPFSLSWNVKIHPNPSMRSSASGLSYKWLLGESVNTIADCLSGLHFFAPLLKGTFRQAWRLFKSWCRVESLSRAPPHYSSYRQGQGHLGQSCGRLWSLPCLLGQSGFSCPSSNGGTSLAAGPIFGTWDWLRGCDPEEL